MNKEKIYKLLKTISPMLIVYILNLICIYLNFYQKITNLDSFFHFVGGLSVSLSFSLFYYYFKFTIKPKLFFYLFLFSFTALIGVVWEFSEFIHDLLLPNIIYQINLADTIKDLSLDLIGSLILIILIESSDFKNKLFL